MAQGGTAQVTGLAVGSVTVMVLPMSSPCPRPFCVVLAATGGKDTGSGNDGSVSLWITNPVSDFALSVKVRVTSAPGPVLEATRLVGASGGTWKIIGRIMSFSS